MSLPDELQARPGEKILPKWEAVARWIRSLQVQAPGAAISYGPGGAQVVFDPREYGQNIRFRVTLTDGKVTVGDGTINGIVPKVNGVPITGSTNPPQPAPQIQTASGNSDATSFVCIKTTHGNNGAVTDATIECKTSLPGGMRADYAGTDGYGYIPIAVIRHDPQTKQPTSVHQHSVHNLQCRMYQSNSGRRVIYWPA